MHSTAHVQPLWALAEQYAKLTGATDPDRSHPHQGGINARVLVMPYYWEGWEKHPDYAERAADGTKPWLWGPEGPGHDHEHGFVKARRECGAEWRHLSLANCIPAWHGDNPLPRADVIYRYIGAVVREHRDLYAIVPLGKTAQKAVLAALTRYGNPNGAQIFEAPTYGPRSIAQYSNRAERDAHLSSALRTAVDYAYPLGAE